MAFSLGLVNASELDLSSGTANVSGKDTVQLNNLTLDGNLYNAEIQLNLDGTYSVVSSMLLGAVVETEPTIAVEQTADYEVTFVSTWSSTTHPDSFPSGSAHFSGLIGATHNASVNLWKVGELASAGIESMAETGSKSLLTNEINMAIMNGAADQLLSGGGLSTSPDNVSLSFQVNADFPYVTLVSMIAPSPDWFVGTESLNLMVNGNWQDELSVTLFAYDSGTDSGTNYTASNSDTQPPDVISKIEISPFVVNDLVTPLGTMTFKKK